MNILLWLLVEFGILSIIQSFIIDYSGFIGKLLGKVIPFFGGLLSIVLGLQLLGIIDIIK